MQSFACLFASLCLLASAAPAAIDWQSPKTNTVQGLSQYVYTVDGCEAWVIAPKHPRPGNPWVWCMEFPFAFSDRTGVMKLAGDGFYFVHIKVGNTFGCPAAQKHFEAFYDFLRSKGLASKGALIGISRGGLYAFRFAAAHPDRVTCVYGDAPVCDFKSWPAGKGQGEGSPADWQSLIKCYGFANEAEALAYRGNPVDNLAPLAKAGIPVILVVGDVDTTVPWLENAAIVEQRYQKLGGTVSIFHKKTCNHHPHGLDNPAPVVDLITRYAAQTQGAAR